MLDRVSEVRPSVMRGAERLSSKESRRVPRIGEERLRLEIERPKQPALRVLLEQDLGYATVIPVLVAALRIEERPRPHLAEVTERVGRRAHALELVGGDQSLYIWVVLALEVGDRLLLTFLPRERLVGLAHRRDEGSDAQAERCTDLVHGDVRVLDGVVEESGDDRVVAAAEPVQDFCDTHRMGDVWEIRAFALLPRRSMSLGRKAESLLESRVCPACHLPLPFSLPLSSGLLRQHAKRTSI